MKRLILALVATACVTNWVAPTQASVLAIGDRCLGNSWWQDFSFSVDEPGPEVARLKVVSTTFNLGSRVAIFERVPTGTSITSPTFSEFSSSGWYDVGSSSSTPAVAFTTLGNAMAIPGREASALDFRLNFVGDPNDKPSLSFNIFAYADTNSYSLPFDTFSVAWNPKDGVLANGVFTVVRLSDDDAWEANLDALVAEGDRGVVPEPTSLAIWSLIGAGCWFGQRMCRSKNGFVGGSFSGTLPRQRWTNENRTAICAIVERRQR